MLRRLFGAGRRAPMRFGSVPPGERLYAVGDVHGRLDLLDELLAMIDLDARGAAYRLVLLGDFVDRGPDSAGVVERARTLTAERTAAALMGNHEELLLSVLDGDEDATRVFCRAGGRETALSYGMDADEYAALDFAELARRMAELVPKAHREWLTALQDQLVAGDYAFVHAGVRPGVPLAEQVPADLRWIRGAFLRHAEPFEKTVVHGHTITEEVDFRPNRIGIDTGAYATGRLTALGLEDDRYWTVQTGGAAGA